MGDMADMLMWDERDLWGDDDDPGSMPLSRLAASYFALPSETLVKETSRARDDKIKGIRNHYARFKTLSEKQRWCLCFWLATHEEA